jgi:ABC-2 type transport system ATP-binding protein
MIKVQNLSKSYKDVKALDGFSYVFQNGIYAILGPNGSGKTTLMSILSDNLFPDCGEVVVNTGLDDNSNTRSIGYVPQYPGMYPDFTVYEMLDYIALLSKATDKERQIDELISIFDLSEYINKKLRALSGGTKQRLAIAQAFLASPNLVLLDEPTAGLDPLQRITFKNFISERRKNATIIISTHIVSDVEEIADEVIFLKKGVVVKSGKLSDVVSSLNGRCWKISNVNDLNEKALYRIIDNDIRVVSSTKPTDTAVLVNPTLEECYLDIFGDGQYEVL